MIKKFEEFNYVTSTTFDNNFKYNFITKNKPLYGIHDIKVYIDGKVIEVKSKFDTGAYSSSICISKLKEIGISDDIIKSYEELKLIKVDKSITDIERKKLERKYTREYSSRGISKVKLIKSASGAGFRPLIKAKIDIYGKMISTEINITDRAGLNCDMLIGLKDLV